MKTSTLLQQHSPWESLFILHLLSFFPPPLIRFSLNSNKVTFIHFANRQPQIKNYSFLFVPRNEYLESFLPHILPTQIRQFLLNFFRALTLLQPVHHLIEFGRDILPHFISHLAHHAPHCPGIIFQSG